MINLGELEGVCDAMIEEGLDWCPPAGCGSAVQAKELITMLREAQKDAKRWEKLVEMHQDDDCGIYVCSSSKCGFQYFTLDDLPGCVDEAMSHEAS